jgi:integrase
MPKLTRRTVDAVRRTAGERDVVVWDDELRGFGLRVRPPFGCFYVVQYRNKHGRTRKLTLGRPEVLSPEEARKIAKSRLADVEKGNDPAADRDESRSAQTVGELCEEYLTAEANRIKASTLRMDKSRIDRHVKPLLGNRRLNELTPALIEKFMSDVASGKTAVKPDGPRSRGDITTGGRGVAARTVGMLGTILQRAVRDGSIPNNPVRGVKRPKDNAKKPAFSLELVKRLGDALQDAEKNGEAKAGLLAIKILLLTGCRRMEVLALRKDAVDFQAQCLRLADTKSGPQIRPIGKSALNLIEVAIAASDAKSEFVFSSKSKAGHLVGLPKVWERISSSANLRDMSIHGLRHWFASAAAEFNFSELTIAGLLGHRVKGVTARYATAPDRALVTAADSVSLALREALSET